MQTVLGQVPSHLARVRNAERIANLENATVSADSSFGITPTSWNEEDVPKIEPLVGDLGKDKDALGRDKEKLVLVAPGDAVANDLVNDTGKEAKGGELAAVGDESTLIAQAAAHISTWRFIMSFWASTSIGESKLLPPTRPSW